MSLSRTASRYTLHPEYVQTDSHYDMMPQCVSNAKSHLSVRRTVRFGQDCPVLNVLGRIAVQRPYARSRRRRSLQQPRHTPNL